MGRENKLKQRIYTKVHGLSGFVVSLNFIDFLLSGHYEFSS